MFNPVAATVWRTWCGALSMQPPTEVMGPHTAFSPSTSPLYAAAMPQISAALAAPHSGPCLSTSHSSWDPPGPVAGTFPGQRAAGAFGRFISSAALASCCPVPVHSCVVYFVQFDGCLQQEHWPGTSYSITATF